jgi:ABC-type multidrug transport system ATPase subunit
VVAADGVALRLGGRAILRQAYVDADMGAVTALVGVSGAGKTTLLRVLVGRTRPDAGHVRWAGERMDRPRLALLARRGLAYLPDHPWLSPRLTVGEHLDMAARSGTAPRAEDVRPIEIDWHDRPPDTLSTGERRLTELAMAITRGATALVLDEPFRELDPLHRERFGAELRRRAAEGRAVLFADHDVTSVMAFADRVFSIEEGATRLIVGFRDRPIAEWYREWPGR